VYHLMRLDADTDESIYGCTPHRPERDWTGESGSWMSSSRSDSIANAAKILFGNNVTHMVRMKVR